jgi:hypothetical protein
MSERFCLENLSVRTLRVFGMWCAAKLSASLHTFSARLLGGLA